MLVWNNLLKITLVFLLLFLGVSIYGFLGKHPDPRGVFELGEIFKIWFTYLIIACLGFYAGKE